MTNETTQKTMEKQRLHLKKKRREKLQKNDKDMIISFT